MGTKIDLENDHVHFMELSVEEARNLTEEVIDKIEHALDEAQADVFTDRQIVTYLVIEIKKGV